MRKARHHCIHVHGRIDYLNRDSVTALIANSLDLHQAARGERLSVIGSRSVSSQASADIDTRCPRDLMRLANFGAVGTALELRGRGEGAQDLEHSRHEPHKQFLLGSN